jgi:transposase
MGRLVSGMDPHKRSAAIEVIDARERVLRQGRYGTDTDGYQSMLTAGRQFPDRVWAVEGCAGIGRHIAQRLVTDGQRCLTYRRSSPRAGVRHRARASDRLGRRPQRRLP